ncbi:MAG: hypothetical protein NZM35_07120 [Chitinophagales bacterium]|nr:hypothetical protein [Chitinophagales bacterium]MDW8418995.1 hypothetical protein [Chitinophagales bacterium]
MNIGYLYLFLNILVVTYSQIILKWQLQLAGPLPEQANEKVKFLFYFLLNPWVISAIAAVGIGSITWILVLTKFELSYVYPFSLLSYVAVIALSYWLFQENITLLRLTGISIVLLGMVIISKS